jgi:hypothetical protein
MQLFGTIPAVAPLELDGKTIHAFAPPGILPPLGEGYLVL